MQMRRVGGFGGHAVPDLSDHASRLHVIARLDRDVGIEVGVHRGIASGVLHRDRNAGKSVLADPGDHAFSDGTDLGAGGENTYVASYCAFAPADDPEVIMLFMCDEPTGENFYGSQVAAPVCSKVLSEVLPYLGFFPEYTDEELAELEVSVPNEVYQTITEAKQTIEALDLEVTIVGEGNTVLSQSPDGGTVQRGGSVVLYTDNTSSAETVVVPDVSGLTKQDARYLLQSVGLNMTLVGSVGTGTTEAYAEASAMTGKTVPVGTAVPVSFIQYTINSQ